MANKAFDHFKRNAFNYLGSVIGVLGLASGFYFYDLSKQFAEPIIKIEPERTEIVSAISRDTNIFKVVKANGTPLKGGLYAIRLSFWNNGNKGIKKENILVPIRIQLDDSGEILQSKMVSYSREIIELNIVPDSVMPTKAVVINFRILEGSDGGIAQIIYEGNKEAKFSVSGLIESVTEIRNEPPLSFRHALLKFIKGSSVVFLILLCIVTYSFATDYFQKAPKGSLSDKIGTGFLFVFLGGIALIFLIMIPISIYKGVIEGAKEGRKSEILERFIPAK